MLTCELLKNDQLRFSNTCESCTDGTSLTECIKFGKSQIVEALALKNLGIRKITHDDIILMRTLEFSEALCGEMFSNLFPALSDIEDYRDPAKTVADSGTRYTWVLVSGDEPDVPVGFLSAILNWNTNSYTNYDNGFEAQYISLRRTNSLYVELGCSSPAKKHRSGGTNYFLRAWVILTAMQDAPVTTVWGQVSGEATGGKRGEMSSSESQKSLFSQHQARRCWKAVDSQNYVCNSVDFLNEFFRRLNLGELLRWVTKDPM
jgi:hypothetical protein